MKRLVVASSNPGKLAELRTLLSPLGMEIVSQSELGIADAEEPHFTFLENALAKARHASRISGLPAMADDSGLCVDALNGAPGVNSAYYAGRQGSREERDTRNNARLLEDLAHIRDRSAHYACVVVLVRHADDPQPLVAEGNWRGEIALAPRGTHGFGYDPLFLLPKWGRTSAEIAPEEKNRISHRAKAMQELISRMRDDPL